MKEMIEKQKCCANRGGHLVIYTKQKGENGVKNE